MNKHGFTGVRKRCSPQHWRKPYYARISWGCEKFVYSRNVATAEEASAEYDRLNEAKKFVQAAGKRPAPSVSPFLGEQQRNTTGATAGETAPNSKSAAPASQHMRPQG